MVQYGTQPGLTDFNPLPSCEGRRSRDFDSQDFVVFQSTPLMRGETIILLMLGYFPTNFNPLPSCEGRLTEKGIAYIQRNFNPLPSCEGRLNCDKYRKHCLEFQSTPLMRGETVCPFKRLTNKVEFQSTPLMRGETNLSPDLPRHLADFNPLPSCEGRLQERDKILRFIAFQSTPLMRGETCACVRT